MPENPNPNPEPQPGGLPDPGSPPIPQPEPQPQGRVIDPERYDALEATFAALAPYADDIQRWMSDEDARKIAKSSWQTWDQNRKGAEPENPLEKKVDKLVGYVENLETQNKRQAALNHISLLANEHTFLKEDNWKAVGEFEREASSLGITDPMAQARYIERVVARLPKSASREEPPTSLRADSANPGVPGRPSSKPTDPQQIRDWLITQARKAQ